MDINFTDYERNVALRNAHHIHDSDAYFEARPQIDSNDRRKVFEAGYERAWESLRQQLTKPADDTFSVSKGEWEAMEELERALCVIGVVGKIDGYDVVRRESVINIARDRIAKSKVNHG
jgi:hypothetical protein